MSSILPDSLDLWKRRAESSIRQRDAAREQRDQAYEQRDAARDMCVRLEYALYMLGAWDPTNPVGREMIAEDLLRGGAASIERAQ